MRRLAAVILGGVLLLVVLAAIGVVGILLLGNPDDETRSSFVSPSGARTLYLIETCQPEACSHEALIEMPGIDRGTVQVRCGLDVVAAAPVFDAVEVEWTPAEDAVLVHLGNSGAAETSFAIDFAEHCNA